MVLTSGYIRNGQYNYLNTCIEKESRARRVIHTMSTGSGDVGPFHVRFEPQGCLRPTLSVEQIWERIYC